MASSLLDSVAPHEKLLAFQDFFPKKLKEKEYETLKDLIVNANKWLESHPEHSVNTCETFNVKVHSDGADPERMSYMRKGQDEDSFTLAGRNYYLRCLRLWLIPHMSSSKPNQIGMKTFTPKLKTGKDVVGIRFDDLEETLREINDSFRMTPVEGRIISVETKPVKYSSAENFKPNKSNWSELTDERKFFVFVIRIFFLYGPITVELIDFKDFALEPTWPLGDKINFDSLKAADSFKKLTEKAQEWIEDLQGVRIANMHAIDIKMKISQFSENRLVMSFTEHNERATFYWRALRAVCLTQLQSNSMCNVQKLTYKTFTPVLLTNKGSFENMSETFRRVHAWLSVVKRSCHISIFCIETLPIRFNTGGEKHHGGAEATWTVYKGSRDERWIYIIRVYIEGTFTEPPINSLPYVPPVLEKSSCKIQ